MQIIRFHFIYFIGKREDRGGGGHSESHNSEQHFQGRPWRTRLLPPVPNLSSVFIASPHSFSLPEPSFPAERKCGGKMCIRDKRAAILTGWDLLKIIRDTTFHTQGQIKGINNKTWPDGWGFIGNSFEIKRYWENCLGLNWRRDVNAKALVQRLEGKRPSATFPVVWVCTPAHPAVPHINSGTHHLARDGEI